MKTSVKVFRVVAVVACLGIAQIGYSSSLLTGTFMERDENGNRTGYGRGYGGAVDSVVDLGDYSFETHMSWANFDASMNYRWEVSTPGDVFSVDTLGLAGWNIHGNFGLGHDEIPLGTLTLRDLTISLENETGSLAFNRTVVRNALWPSEQFVIPIAGAGTFTAITFTLNFENYDPSWIGATTVISTYAEDPENPQWPRYWSNWVGMGPDGQEGTGFVTVVPEPSSGVLLVLGIGGVIALRRCRRSGV